MKKDFIIRIGFPTFGIMGRKITILTDEFERELVQMLANDTTGAKAAQIYGISKKAMDGRIRKTRAKYGLKSIAGLCVHFYRNGWIT